MESSAHKALDYCPGGMQVHYEPEHGGHFTFSASGLLLNDCEHPIYLDSLNESHEEITANIRQQLAQCYTNAEVEEIKIMRVQKQEELECGLRPLAIMTEIALSPLGSITPEALANIRFHNKAQLYAHL